MTMLLAGDLPGYVNKPAPRYVVTERPFKKRGYETQEPDAAACVEIDCYEPVVGEALRCPRHA